MLTLLLYILILFLETEYKKMMVYSLSKHYAKTMDQFFLYAKVFHHLFEFTFQLLFHLTKRTSVRIRRFFGKDDGVHEVCFSSSKELVISVWGFLFVAFCLEYLDCV